LHYLEKFIIFARCYRKKSFDLKRFGIGGKNLFLNFIPKNGRKNTIRKRITHWTTN